MSIHKETQAFIASYESALTALQISVSGAFCALIHSEYLRNMRSKQKPIRKVLVPEIKMVHDWLDEDRFTEWLADVFIDQLIQDPTIRTQINTDAFRMFRDNKEILKTIFELKMMPGISEYIESRIKIQFALDRPGGMYQESPDLYIFDGSKCTDQECAFLVHQTALQLISVLARCTREFPEHNEHIHLCDDEILILRNSGAISMLCFDTSIIESPAVRSLAFVSSSTFVDLLGPENHAQKTDGRTIHWGITTSPFNEVAIVRPEQSILSDQLYIPT